MTFTVLLKDFLYFGISFLLLKFIVITVDVDVEFVRNDSQNIPFFKLKKYTRLFLFPFIRRWKSEGG